MGEALRARNEHLAMTQTQLLVLVAVCLLVAIAIGVWFSLQQRTRKLRQKFGPEYGRTVARVGDRTKAESELRERQRRVARLRIEPLPPGDAARFDSAWKTVQARFVDDPASALAEADDLIRKLMARRGYPMGDFEARAADISVDHPKVVENYREAHAIALRHQRGETNTEELRRALIHYRALFDDLLEVRSAHQPAQPGHIAGAKP
jgi:hypothetical protein